MNELDEVFQSQTLELRRGSVVLAIVGVLKMQKQYGYSLLRILNQQDFEIEGNTLYPLLRRLEKQGVLQAEWETSDKRPRKYYSLTTEGLTLFEKLVDEWRSMNEKIESIIKEKL